MIKLDTENVKNPNFKDVSTANGYCKSIAAMVEKGIIGGYHDGRYGPNDPIKRGQMASILVKAFDLPRDIGDNNPFKDVSMGWGLSGSHDGNILVLYRFGITSGTTPSTFSPNMEITRGQAAVMIKATENVKRQDVVTLEPSDFGWDSITWINDREINTGLFKAILIHGKEGYTKDKVQLIPLKEGKGPIVFHGKASKTADMDYRKRYVSIKKENGELKLTLEETNDFLTTPVQLDMRYLVSGKYRNLSGDVRNISLATMDGKLINDSTTSKACNDYYLCIDIDKPGEYIATVRFADKKEVRYGIEAKADGDKFYYTVRALKEQLTDSFTLEDETDIGTYRMWPNNYEQIVDVTKEPGKNTFHFTAKKGGYVAVRFNKSVYGGLNCDHPDVGYCHKHYLVGLSVDIDQIGSIIHIWARGENDFEASGVEFD